MNSEYDPKAYWDARLLAHGGLRGTGHISFDEKYNGWLYRAKERTLLRALGDRPLAGQRVLDVGCGNGYFVRWYQAHQARVTGIDISPNAIDAMRQKFTGEFHVLDISAVQSATLGTFDVVNVWDVMYHIVDDAGFERALRFLAASVGPSGRLLVSDRLGAGKDVSVAAHVRMRCLETYQRIMAAAGFQLQGVEFLYRWLNRYVSLPPLDSRLGRFYYWLDGRERAIPADNLSLGVWRRIASS